MANEINYAGIGDLTTVEALSTKYLLLLADRNALPSHPAINLGYQRDMAGAGSSVLKVPHVGIFGYDIYSTVTEGSDVANTALTDGSSTITIVEKAKAYEYTDFARMLDSTGVIRPDVFAVDAVVSAGATMLDMLANLVDNFSSTQGTTTVDATARNFLDCRTALTVAKVIGPYIAVLHPVQWGDITADVVLSSGGAIQFNPGNAMLLSGMQGLGYQGNYLGIDVFTTTRVPTANAGADRAGGVFGAGAIVWADGTYVPDWTDPNIMTLADKVRFERVRGGRGGNTALVSKRVIGMSEGLDAAGVSLITDA